MCKDMEGKWEREERLNMRLEFRSRPREKTSALLLLKAMGSLAAF